jgi:hypothetical protein
MPIENRNPERRGSSIRRLPYQWHPMNDPRKEHFGPRRYEECTELHGGLVIPAGVKSALKPGMVIRCGYSQYGWFEP